MISLTNKNYRENKNAFGVGHGNVKNSKLFEGLVILNKKKEKSEPPHTEHIVSLLNFSSLLFILSPLLLSLLFSLFSCPVLSFSLSSLSVSPCFSLALYGSVSVCCCVVLLLWCVECGVWCDTLEKPPCVLSKKRPRVCWHHAHSSVLLSKNDPRRVITCPRDVRRKITIGCYPF